MPKTIYRPSCLCGTPAKKTLAFTTLTKAGIFSTLHFHHCRNETFDRCFFTSIDWCRRGEERKRERRKKKRKKKRFPLRGYNSKETIVCRFGPWAALEKRGIKVRPRCENKPQLEDRNWAGSRLRFHALGFGMCQKKRDMCSVFTAEEMTSQGSPPQRSAKEFGLHVFIAPPR